MQRQAIPNPGQPDHLKNHRLQLKIGNRDLYGLDFKWVNESDIAKREDAGRRSSSSSGASTARSSARR